MTGAVDLEHFAAYYRAAHAHWVHDRIQLGPDPFPWQLDLVAEVMQRGTWPATIDVPTGLGKTSMIDIAVYVAAMTPPGQGPGRRRTFFVIDRRVVVDEAFEHALALRDALAQALGSTEPIGEVARRLVELVGRDGIGEVRAPRPLDVTRMRGGVTWSWRWLDRPDQPAVVIGTVDQLGSRFLFNGYGVAPRLRPIDAALVGTDSLIVIDEAHLARPFVETVEWAARLGPSDLELANPLVVTMSATPPTREQGSTGAWSFTIDLDKHLDGDEQEAAGVAARRLGARKELRAIAVPKKREPSAVPVVLADAARSLLDPDGGVKAVGVVCNTVGRARAVHRRLAELLDEDAVELALLTGRVRPYDAAQIKDRMWRHIAAGRDRHAAKPAVLVTTQTIEVGVNVDFDALVTESAAIDALVQRLGRLNRLGELNGTSDHVGVALVVHHDVQDFVYGAARDATWQVICEWVTPTALSAKGKVPIDGPGVDVSPRELRERLAALGPVLRRELETVAPATPALYPELLDDWVQTSPALDLVTEPEPFLHGFRDGAAEVTLVWRADLPPIPDAGERGADESETWQDVIDRLPPAAGEQLTVPLAWVRRWLLGDRDADGFGDVLAAEEMEMADEPEQPATDFSALIWRGPANGQLLHRRKLAQQIRPGDIVVLPSSAGGCDQYGWDPASNVEVSDLAELCAPRSVLRIDSRTIAQLVNSVDPAVAGAINDAVSEWVVAHGCALDEGVGVWPSVVKTLYRAAEIDELDEWVHDLCRVLREHAPVPFKLDGIDHIQATGHPGPSALGVIVSCGPRFAVSFEQTPEGNATVEYAFDGGDGADDVAGSSVLGGRVSLNQHQIAVGKRARSIAAKLGLPDDVVETIGRAAEAHDLGKSDPRFQIRLWGGDRTAAQIAMANGELLAKSGMDPADRAAFRRANREAGLPRGYRHEAHSAQAVALVDSDGTIDRELLVHLVASHHGCARPLLPAVLDKGSPFEIEIGGRSAEIDPSATVDFDHPQRFVRLVRRYGYWGLALLEAIVRLSDIGCSEEGT